MRAYHCLISPLMPIKTGDELHFPDKTTGRIEVGNLDDIRIIPVDSPGFDIKQGGVHHLMFHGCQVTREIRSEIVELTYFVPRRLITAEPATLALVRDQLLYRPDETMNVIVRVAPESVPCLPDDLRKYARGAILEAEWPSGAKEQLRVAGDPDERSFRPEQSPSVGCSVDMMRHLMKQGLRLWSPQEPAAYACRLSPLERDSTNRSWQTFATDLPAHTLFDRQRVSVEILPAAAIETVK